MTTSTRSASATSRQTKGNARFPAQPSSLPRSTAQSAISLRLSRLMHAHSEAHSNMTPPVFLHLCVFVWREQGLGPQPGNLSMTYYQSADRRLDDGLQLWAGLLESVHLLRVQRRYLRVWRILPEQDVSAKHRTVRVSPANGRKGTP